MTLAFIRLHLHDPKKTPILINVNSIVSIKHSRSHKKVELTTSTSGIHIIHEKYDEIEGLIDSFLDVYIKGKPKKKDKNEG